MSNLTEVLNSESQTVKAIYDWYKQHGDSERPRGYLGASIIGHFCDRYLWYAFRFCFKATFTGRMYRLFDTGNWEEKRIAFDLERIGCEVHVLDENGKQFAVSDLSGHFSGHLDGCVIGVKEAPKTWHVLECKTHNDKSFNELKKKGVKESKPQHYAQMQVYMHLTKMERALYFAVNKDTDELYAERIKCNKDEARSYIERAKRIITASSPMGRISERQDWYQCKFCDAKRICWGDSECALPIPEINCRQCCHATPELNGNDKEWHCSRHNIDITKYEVQQKACDQHLIIPDLLTFAKPIDSNINWIRFENEHKEQFTVGTWKPDPGGCTFYTEELMKLPPRDLVNPLVIEAKKQACKITNVQTDDIISRYKNETVLWSGEINSLEQEWKTLFNEELTQQTPIAKADNFDNKVAEFTKNRIAIIYNNGKAKIMQQIPF